MCHSSAIKDKPSTKVNGWVSLIDFVNGKICVMGNSENSDEEGMFLLKLEEENGKMNRR